MGQFGFVGPGRRHDGLDAKRDPPAALATEVASEAFRPRLKAAWIAGRLRTADATRSRPLGARQQAAGRTRSTMRARVEHAFGHRETSAGQKLVRTMGLVQAKTRIGMQNPIRNMRRFVTLERMAAAR